MQSVYDVDRVLQALDGRGSTADRERAEKQLIALLALPLARPDAVEVLGLSEYPKVMALLAPTSRKVRLCKLRTDLGSPASGY